MIDGSRLRKTIIWLALALRRLAGVGGRTAYRFVDYRYVVYQDYVMFKVLNVYTTNDIVPYSIA
jgi:hypothetical protein